MHFFVVIIYFAKIIVKIFFLVLLLLVDFISVTWYGQQKCPIQYFQAQNIYVDDTCTVYLYIKTASAHLTWIKKSNLNRAGMVFPRYPIERSKGHLKVAPFRDLFNLSMVYKENQQKLVWQLLQRLYNYVQRSTTIASLYQNFAQKHTQLS